MSYFPSTFLTYIDSRLWARMIVRSFSNLWPLCRSTGRVLSQSRSPLPLGKRASGHSSHRRLGAQSNTDVFPSTQLRPVTWTPPMKLPSLLLKNATVPLPSKEHSQIQTYVLQRGSLTWTSPIRLSSLILCAEGQRCISCDAAWASNMNTTYEPPFTSISQPFLCSRKGSVKWHRHIYGNAAGGSCANTGSGASFRHYFLYTTVTQPSLWPR